MYHTGLDFFMKAGWRNMEKNQKNLFFLRNSDPFVSRITIHPNFGAVFGLKKRSWASRQICHLYSGNSSTLKYAKIVNAWKINENNFRLKLVKLRYKKLGFWRKKTESFLIINFTFFKNQTFKKPQRKYTLPVSDYRTGNIKEGSFCNTLCLLIFIGVSK